MTTETSENVETSTEDVTGLKAKNRELHGIIKKLEAQVSKLTDDVSDAFENAKAESGSELDKANRQIAKLTKERDDAITRADAAAKGLREYKATNSLTSAIASANVDSDHVAMLTKAMRADIQFDDAGEPNIEGKTIEAYANSFFSDAGKRYVRAADHNGGGASGSEGSKAPRMTKENFSYGEFAKIQLSNPEEANAIADAVGKPELKTSL